MSKKILLTIFLILQQILLSSCALTMVNWKHVHTEREVEYRHEKLAKNALAARRFQPLTHS